MYQRIREVRVRHLESIIHSPKRSTETVRDTGETTTRGSVRFEHDKRFTSLLCDGGRVEIGLDEVDASVMRKVVREVFLRVLVCASTELSVTIVIWVTKKKGG